MDLTTEKSLFVKFYNSPLTCKRPFYDRMVQILLHSLRSRSCLTCRGRVRGTDNSFWLANRRRAVRQKRYCAVWNYGVYRVNCAVYNFWYTASRSVAQHIEQSVVDLRS